MRRLAYLWRNHRIASLAFALVAALTIGFAIRSALFAFYWSDPASRDQQVQGWMTPRYVAHSWKVPPEVMQAALGEVALPDRRRTLEDIAADRGVPLGELIFGNETEIARFRAEQAVE